MKIFGYCASYWGEAFDIDMVDGGTCDVPSACQEDYMIAMAYVADCHTYGRSVNLEKFDVDSERDKMVDLFLSLLQFE